MENSIKNVHRNLSNPPTVHLYAPNTQYFTKILQLCVVQHGAPESFEALTYFVDNTAGLNWIAFQVSMYVPKKGEWILKRGKVQTVKKTLL